MNLRSTRFSARWMGAASPLLVSILACAQAAPPTNPPTIEVPPGSIYPDEIKVEPPVDWRTLKQPQTLVDDLLRVQSGSMKQRIEALKRKLANDMVFVEGGTFWMGDFGHLQSQEKLPWTGQLDNKPLRHVTLSSFSLSRYKVTYAEFDLFTEATNSPKVQTQAGFADLRHVDVPAGVTWYQARAYCQWLGRLTKKPVALPTEAQWEYAARNQGKFIVYPTDSGRLEWGRNVAYGDEQFEGLKSRPNRLHAIGHFPATALGFHDMARLGLEWAEDWYSPNFSAATSRTRNPRGPSTGKYKVQRGWPMTNDGAAMTMYRRFTAPDEAVVIGEDGGQKRGGGTGDTFRCALQSTVPLNP